MGDRRKSSLELRKVETMNGQMGDRRVDKKGQFLRKGKQKRGKMINERMGDRNREKKNS